MKTILILLGMMVSISSLAQNPDNMKEQIKSVINTFVQAGTDHDVAAYDHVLHPEFRVIANQFPTPDKTSVIPGPVYKSMVGNKTIGGTAYQVHFHLDGTQS